MSHPIGETIEPDVGEDAATAPLFLKQAEGRSAGASVLRQTGEFVVVLCLSILIFRTFAAEAYIVPTGSMAPTLLGNHREMACPNCGFRFTLGQDEDGRSGQPTCPNCGQTGMDGVASVECNGDRVLVQKFLYDFRRPKRWEVSVFHFPGEPSQAYVKRVVGLPGETVRIQRGDVYIDGAIARKALKEQHGMRVLVYDNNFVPKDVSRFPRWTFRRGRPEQGVKSGWEALGPKLVHSGGIEPEQGIDWVDYKHWDPERARYSSVHDFNGYNGADVRSANTVADLMVEARVSAGADAKSLSVRIESLSDRFRVEIPVGEGAPLAWRNRKPLTVSGASGGLKAGGKGALLEVSVMDRRLTAAIDGVALFDPIDYEEQGVGPGSGDSPVGLGTTGGSIGISDIKIYRDVYYTSALAFSPRKAFGIDAPYTLGVDEFFVLGDNSPVSNDSRFWAGSPVVPGELFLGKPFLVHLPGQVVPLEVFGRSVYWVPDPREIRYIR